MRRSCATRSMIPTMTKRLASLTAATTLALLASCADRPATSRDDDAETGDQRASTRVKGSATELDDAAADLKAAFNRQQPDPAAGARNGPVPGSRAKMEPVPKRPGEPPAPRIYPEPAPTALTAPMPRGIDELASRRDELVTATARTLRAWTDAGGDPTLASVQYAALGAFATTRPPALPSTWLDSDQRKSADAIEGLMRDLASQGPRGLDTATAGALLSQRAAELGATPAPSSTSAVVQTGPVPSTSVFGVPAVALCRKVDSFGVYEPLASTTFQVGRTHTMIVYTEVEGFEQRAATTLDKAAGFASELSQTVMLYHDSDGLLAWTRPEVTIRDTTRRQRRDYYLVQRLELPSTLTIGKYNLKILVRDKLTGAEAETTVPLSMVASQAQR